MPAQVLKRRGETIANCKYLYPQNIYPAGTSFPVYNPGNDRWDQECFEEEDTQLSTYVPLWLLALGACMNIQYCTTSGFLSYIAKYISKPEPYGTLYHTQDLQLCEDGVASPLRAHVHTFRPG